MKFVKDIEKYGLQTSLEMYCPGIFVTPHVLDSRKTNRVRVFFGTVAILCVSFINSFRKRKVLFNSYDVLVYVPNEKYTRFLTALADNAKYSYLVVSDSRLSIPSITLEDAASFSRLGYFGGLFSSYFRLKRNTTSADNKRLLCKYYWNIMSVLRRDLLLEKMLSKISFKYFFSLQPIDSYHSVIHVAYKNNFQKTLAIRPTTTTRNKENSCYICDVLFYKTEEEFDIYKEACNPAIQLVRGGLLYSTNIFRSHTRINNRCICFDTCTSKDEKWNQSRLSFLYAFLEYANKNSINVFYKFHPGLLAEPRKKTEEKLSQYDNVVIIDNNVPWDEVDFSIGFSSTIFFDSILHGIPVFDMGEMTYFFDKEHQVYCIKKVEELEILNDFYKNRDAFVNDQYNWICKKYNYPEGISLINRMLEE